VKAIVFVPSLAPSHSFPFPSSYAVWLSLFFEGPHFILSHWHPLGGLKYREKGPKVLLSPLVELRTTIRAIDGPPAFFLCSSFPNLWGREFSFFWSPRLLFSYVIGARCAIENLRLRTLNISSLPLHPIGRGSPLFSSQAAGPFFLFHSSSR